MHRDDDFENDEGNQLNNRFPGTRNKIKNSARCFEHQKRQPEMSQNPERAAGTSPV